MVLEPHFDLRVLGFAVGVSVATALPLQSRAGDARRRRETGCCRRYGRPQPPRSSAGRRASHLVGPPALRRGALSANASHLNRVPSGFDRDHVLTLQVEATVPGRTLPPKTSAEFRADHARLGAIRTVAVLVTRSAAAAGSTSVLSGPISLRDRRGGGKAGLGPAPCHVSTPGRPDLTIWPLFF